MWVLVLAILVGVVVLATGMRSSVDEAWIGRSDGDPADVDDLVPGPRAPDAVAAQPLTYLVDPAA